ncbi:hypothetical protein JHK86_008782 [Glycine max]|nr:hypothetical protein JHK86_008782 [Glycine max]
MAGGGEGGDTRQLDLTPTWAVAAMFEERKQHALLEALEKIKAELMVLGFISLLLTFGQNYISKMCIPSKYAKTMLPCVPPEERHGAGHHTEEAGGGEAKDGGHRRRLLSYERRFLASGGGGQSCKPIRGWKAWEADHIVDQDALNGKVCFFRQFFRSVRRADYLTMRHGFVTVSSFGNATSVILAVGTKLQGIITRMALDISERHAVVQGIPLVQVSDKYFWFAWPQLVLYLIHYVLFQYEFGWASCFYEDDSLMIVRVALGLGAQVVCSYVTLPLYALVTQMGSTMKKSIFDEQTSKALKQWHKNALKKKPSKGRTETQTLGATGGPRDHSPEQSPRRPSGAGDTEMAEQSATIVTAVDHEPYDNRDLLSGP